MTTLAVSPYLLLLGVLLVTGLSAVWGAILAWHFAALRVDATPCGRGTEQYLAVTLYLGEYPWSDATVALVPVAALEPTHGGNVVGPRAAALRGEAE